MDSAHTLPDPLAAACLGGHPVELWLLVDGSVVPCKGTLMQPDKTGRPRITTSLPDNFVGVVRTGAAVRGFFADDDGSIHTFLSSIYEWAPYHDQPYSAQVTIDAPTTVSPCQRRRGRRRPAPQFETRLSVTIRGCQETVTGRLVDASSNGISVRFVRNARNWFADGTPVEVEVVLPDEEAPLRFAAVISRVSRETLHYLYGLRVRQDDVGRRMLRRILDRLL